MNANKISILFLLSKAKRNVKGECPIKCRITFQKERKEFSTGYFITDKNWNAKRQRAIGKTADNINSNLGLIKQKLEQAALEYAVLKNYYTVEDIFLKYNGEDDKGHKTLLSIFQLHIDRMEKLIGIEYAPATVVKYKNTRDQIKGFIQWKYSRNDILLEQLKLNFLDDFDFYLKTKLKQRQVTVNKSIQRVKTIIKTAIAEGYIITNPFLLYKPKRAETNVVFLTADELSKLENYKFSQIRLEQVRDCYIFCCYSGLPYLEMATLTREHITVGFDDNLWIKIYRQKTSKELSIPLLPKAARIIEKYNGTFDDDKSIYNTDNKSLLPVISNQKFNSYLKEIAEILAINKRLTHHTARKTFASTVLLYNNVPIEVVSDLLGHSKITVTQQHYGRVVKKKVSEEIKNLTEKLGI